jgi:hypothetical protein
MRLDQSVTPCTLSPGLITALFDHKYYPYNKNQQDALFTFNLFQ